ncbi:hypothetical protein PENSPDRAFT_598917 [Peniophora sp. CONT]|nr:hypothetical protein PENSPDRAFT_598917 [Peniophora sp. CONT]
MPDTSELAQPERAAVSPVVKAAHSASLETSSKGIGVPQTQPERQHTPDQELDPVSLYKAGSALIHRFHQLHTLETLRDAITAFQRALSLTPDDHPQKPYLLNDLGLSLLRFSLRASQPDALQSSIVACRSAIALTASDDPELPRRLDNLDAALGLHANRTRELEDLEECLELGRRAIELTPVDDSALPDRLVNLAGSSRARLECLGKPEDIESVVEMCQRAIELTPQDDRSRPRRLGRLASFLGTRFEYDRSQKNFDAIIECYMSATSQPLGDPVERLNCAEACIQVLSDHPEFTSSESLMLAHSRVFNIIPELIWLGHSIQRRFEESSRVGKLANAAVCAAIDVGDFSRVVEWFEGGRALVWLHVTSIRSPLHDLAARNPILARAFQDIREEVQRLESSAPPNAPSFSLPSIHVGRLGFYAASASDQHRRAARRYEDLLKEIRCCSGFEDFMRPKTLGHFTSSPTFASLSGPVVFTNVDRRHCDALVLFPSGDVKVVKLPELSNERAEKLRSLWTEHVGRGRAPRRASVQQSDIVSSKSSSIYMLILKRLWIWIVRPVLQALEYIQQSSFGKHLPRVIWCPTGPLTQLPLHAAGIYDKGQSALHTFDFVVSSYTPSLSALLRCYENNGGQPSEPKLLLIAQPDVPRPNGPHLTSLPCVRDESAALHALLSGDGHAFLEDELGTVEASLASMKHHSWVHLACHGSQNKADPTQSAFELYDGPLTLSALAGTTSDNAELAFLSACETAVGDPEIPEESVHLAAGMLTVGFKGVVATMWSIKDEDGPIIVEAYYKRLLELRESGRLEKGETGAAYALHDAVRYLREEVGENSFERWVPFVHFGA